MKIAFFDRDGTIIEDYLDHEWTRIERPIFIEGSINTLKEVIKKGYKIILITNQYIINEGYITIDQYHDINNQMINELKVQGVELLDVFYCPHGKDEGCTCIKPETGMIMKAIYKYPEIRLEECFMIGDSIVDIELAINMGIKGFGIGIGSNYKQENIYQLNTIKDLPTYI
ncbi:HAD-IIIA family hydrolase (plasmid) [Priestia megaterium]|uniref:D,D-heptose 1,7-bisphosphate phosphatase n=1 Tax=Priestia megaterium (strain ATCC 14581 / DSM 32 / CCUG 1817 / JCM 2506 / NBRC 15308 / NCIMB 9376 / NCTC 10342 / NRRL B-14308 / VKM B-512 / Ford 19) TaxID=1348623 RepID=A0A0B6ALE7_PRIM2|nr:HAD-IIIA family hydrolase [Priestia megaterium]AJI25705.1 HAD hydrolase, family IIIA domain protein [Priestia megaterium NBRC 15308 = ATCC 14581]KFM95468.1 HAD hydrolase, family IIIA domain protein [Priestia megaterium]KGJ81163.1 D,D-heptose 1,7-bisphosphate phosphatase [Priestia megaterium NBRC 15308 = ATCC 14581]MDR4229816.1 HAD-IIIA family hydrolase [Priestia megaterium]MED3809748.1 HAD-IIIA family hydrolase [Priestia megaterium]